VADYAPLADPLRAFGVVLTGNRKSGIKQRSDRAASRFYSSLVGVRFVTLILSVNGPETIWMLADRRLSRKGQKPKDDARKIMSLETSDGVALLGYAGLGATARGTEPAAWMSAVLRGRNLPLEQSIAVLAEALKREFPRHMSGMPGQRVHFVIVPIFLHEEPRLYEIQLEFAPDGKQYFRHAHCVVDQPTTKPRPPPLALAGSGAFHLEKNKQWIRDLLRIVKAYKRRQVQPHTVADHLANLNYEIHLADKLVGPRCLVVWRHRKGGGAHQFYNGTTRDDSSQSCPFPQLHVVWIWNLLRLHLLRI
jgi:hypothetical protein